MAFSRWADPLFALARLYDPDRAGLWFGFSAPPDYQQGETVRIMFVHVPAAWVALLAYTALGGVELRLAGLPSRAGRPGRPRRGRPSGAAFTLHGFGDWIVLGPADVGRLVGVGRRASGLDARPVPALPGIYGPARQRSTTRREAARAAEILAIVGLINLPVIKFSVDWWNTLHQGESILRAGGPLVAPVYLTPLFLMGGGYCASHFAALWLGRTRAEIWRRRALNVPGTARSHDRSDSRGGQSTGPTSGRPTASAWSDSSP